MTTVEEITNAIAMLSLDQVKQVRDWLEYHAGHEQNGETYSNNRVDTILTDDMKFLLDRRRASLAASPANELTWDEITTFVRRDS